MMFNFGLLKASVLACLVLTSTSSPIAVTQSSPAPHDAKPRSSSYRHLYSPRAVLPTVDECKAALDVRPSGSMFFSGLAGDAFYPPEVLDALANRPVLSGYRIIEQSFLDPAWPASRGEQDPALQYSFWEICSQAYAELTEGLVYVMLPGDVGQGTNWPSMDSVWARIEWPKLAVNDGRAKKIVRISPDNEDEFVLLDIVV